MSTADIDLKNLLDQARILVQELAETSQKVVFEVGTAHYWTTYSIEIFTKLRNIGQNIWRLLDFCEQHWGEGNRIFQHKDALKLWQTALGLRQALPPVRAKLIEHLSRRRRQRIMGQLEEDDIALDPVVVKEDQDQLKLILDEINQLYETLAKRIARIPDLIGPPKDLGTAPANGKLDGVEAPKESAAQDSGTS